MPSAKTLSPANGKREQNKLANRAAILDAARKCFLKMGYDAVRNERYKYIRYRELAGMNELYDLQNDPFELTNLIDAQSAIDVRRRMEAQLDALLKDNARMENR